MMILIAFLVATFSLNPLIQLEIRVFLVMISQGPSGSLLSVAMISRIVARVFPIPIGSPRIPPRNLEFCKRPSVQQRKASLPVEGPAHPMIALLAVLNSDGSLGLYAAMGKKLKDGTKVGKKKGKAPANQSPSKHKRKMDPEVIESFQSQESDRQLRPRKRARFKKRQSDIAEEDVSTASD